LPRAGYLPGFRTEIVEVLSPTNPYGIKAGGEGGTTPPVVVSAILDALAPLGIRDIQLPATGAAIWEAIQVGKERKNHTESGVRANSN
jgi:aerobic carbon-monoxide dehydrogenase large subunit